MLIIGIGIGIGIGIEVGIKSGRHSQASCPVFSIPIPIPTPTPTKVENYSVTAQIFLVFYDPSEMKEISSRPRRDKQGFTSKSKAKL